MSLRKYPRVKPLIVGGVKQALFHTCEIMTLDRGVKQPGWQAPFLGEPIT